jgi:hypothetical protein
LITNGAGVVFAAPIATPESKSLDNSVCPLPAAVKVKLPFPVVANAALAVFPRLRVVADIPNVFAEVIVAKPESDKAVAPESVKVPAVVIVPNVEAFKAEVPFNVTVAALIVSKPLEPLFGVIAIFPVVFPPMVKVLLFNACSEPAPFITSPVGPVPVCAEIDATGVAAPALLMNANLALVVAFAPSSKS